MTTTLAVPTATQIAEAKAILAAAEVNANVEWELLGEARKGEVIEEIDAIVTEYESTMENVMEEADYTAQSSLEDLIAKHGKEIVACALESTTTNSGDCYDLDLDKMFERLSRNR